jgi:hypothetical protein
LKISKILISFIGLFLILMGCSTDNKIEPNGKLMYNHLTLAIDETDLNSYVGFMDYVFIGTVEEVVENVVDTDFPTTVYQVKVDENLKGNLVDKVEVTKQGGYNNEGTLILNATDHSKDNGLPQVNNQYIFIAIGQPDGGLLLAEINGNIELTDESIKNEFKEYIKNEIKYSRERFTSKYDIFSK